MLVYSVLREVISYANAWEPVLALTSDPTYPTILYPDLFGYERGC